MQAIFVGDADQVKSLIGKHIDVNYQSSNGRVAAIHAAAHCCDNSAKLARQAGGEEESKSSASQRHLDILRMLCAAGARINCKDSKNLTPLHYACRSNSQVSLFFVCLLNVSIATLAALKNVKVYEEIKS